MIRIEEHVNRNFPQVETTEIQTESLPAIAAEHFKSVTGSHQWLGQTIELTNKSEAQIDLQLETIFIFLHNFINNNPNLDTELTKFGLVASLEDKANHFSNINQFLKFAALNAQNSNLSTVTAEELFFLNRKYFNLLTQTKLYYLINLLLFVQSQMLTFKLSYGAAKKIDSLVTSGAKQIQFQVMSNLNDAPSKAKQKITEDFANLPTQIFQIGGQDARLNSIPYNLGIILKDSRFKPYTYLLIRHWRTFGIPSTAPGQWDVGNNYASAIFNIFNQLSPIGRINDLFTKVASATKTLDDAQENISNLDTESLNFDLEDIIDHIKVIRKFNQIAFINLPEWLKRPNAEGEIMVRYVVDLYLYGYAELISNYEIPLRSFYSKLDELGNRLIKLKDSIDGINDFDSVIIKQNIVNSYKIALKYLTNTELKLGEEQVFYEFQQRPKSRVLQPFKDISKLKRKYANS